MTKSPVLLRRHRRRRLLALIRALEATNVTVVAELLVVTLTLLFSHRTKAARHKYCQRNQRSLVRIGFVGSAEKAIRV
uniref:Uncharacterized protein n=1 Tax=Anopheles darlingi TaxID=43151 RepID=A0A2M4DPT3_ANODA